MEVERLELASVDGASRFWATACEVELTQAASAPRHSTPIVESPLE